MKLINNKAVLYKFCEFSAIVIMSLSLAVFSLILIPINSTTDFNFEYKITFVFSFFAGFFINKMILKKSVRLFKKRKYLFFISLLISSFVLSQLYYNKGCIFVYKIPNNVFNVFHIRYFILSFLFVYLFFVNLLSNIVDSIKLFWKKMSNKDKKVYKILTIVLSILIVFLYSYNSNLYLQYDRVFSMDSGWVFSNMYPDANYFDIRHPFISLYYFPIWAVVRTFSYFFFTSSDLAISLTAIIIQLLNVQFLIIISFILKKMLNNDYKILMLYLISFPTLLYLIFFEKYVLVVFLIVLYIYYLCNNRERKGILFSTVGVMPTSVFIAIGEILAKYKIKDKLKNLIKIVLYSFTLLIISGRSHLIKYGFDELVIMKNSGSEIILPFWDKIKLVLSLIQNAIFPLPTAVFNNNYLWLNLTENIPFLGILILLICLFGYIFNRKKLFVKLCSIWIVFAFVLFCILNWATYECPLFNIYFSWGIVSLFVLGLNEILTKFKLNTKYIYICLFLITLLVNSVSLINILEFTKTIS